MSELTFDFEYLRALVHQRSGVKLEPYKEYLARLHLVNLVAQAGFSSLAALIDHLKQTPFGPLHQQAIEAMLINETSFFRDLYPFETLKTSVLPTLLQSRFSQRTLNIWCAACSTGQEPYSIAMLIREYFPELSGWTIRIIASDLSKGALDRAKKGQYSQLEVNRGLASVLRDRYFQPIGQFWQIKDEIRHSVEFRQLNLIDQWNNLPKIDIVFLRNVLIYFDLETKRSILKKVQSSLQPDGYLFLGSGETTFHIDPKFEAIHSASSLYHRLRSA